jgi:hypothetical protein
MHGTFKQTGLRSMWLARCWPGDDLLVLTILSRRSRRESIVLTLAMPLLLSSRSTTGISALAPAQRAGAQRLCALAHTDENQRSPKCRLLGVDRKWLTRGRNDANDPERSWALGRVHQSPTTVNPQAAPERLTAEAEAA